MLFISPEKLFSFLTYLNFCSGLSGQVKKRLDNKVKKIMTSCTELVTIHIYPKSQEVMPIRQ